MGKPTFDALDRFGASDAWLMFALWAGVNGHGLTAAFSATICALICFLPDPKPKADTDGETA